MEFIDRLLHRVPWNGDKIRLYRLGAKPIDTFIGEFWIEIRDGNVFVLNQGYIRIDLPKWSGRHACWEYYYSASGGE